MSPPEELRRSVSGRYRNRRRDARDDRTIYGEPVPTGLLHLAGPERLTSNDRNKCKVIIHTFGIKNLASITSFRDTMSPWVPVKTRFGA